MNRGWVSVRGVWEMRVLRDVNELVRRCLREIFDEAWIDVTTFIRVNFRVVPVK